MPNRGIYKIENLVNGYAYIGQSVNLSGRMRRHLKDLQSKRHANFYLQRAFDKYKVENFRFSIVLYCEPSELTLYEQALVDRLRLQSYNIQKECVDSRLGIAHTPESNRKNSDAHKGKPSTFKGKTHSEESNRKNSDAHKGKTISVECIQKSVAAHTGKHLSVEHKRKLSELAMGRTHSEKTKRKISESNMGKTRSEEVKRRQSEARMGRTHSDETRRKIADANSRRHYSEETLRKMSEAQLKRSKNKLDNIMNPKEV